MRLIALTLPMFLATCGGAISSAAPVRNCPVGRDYSQSQLTLAADELDRLGPHAMLAEMMADYRDLRRQARDCWGR